MYSFLVQATSTLVQVQALIKPESTYEFFTYRGKKPVVLNFRGKDVEIAKGTKFGVRPSADGKNIRLIFKDQPTKVHTLTLDQAKKLAKRV